jgi:hypothetical protein
LNTIAWVKFQAQDDHGLPELVALVYNESYKGCSLILVSDRHLQAGEQVHVRVGKLQPLQAKVAWVKILEDKILRAGFQYIEPGEGSGG